MGCFNFLVIETGHSILAFASASPRRPARGGNPPEADILPCGVSFTTPQGPRNPDIYRDKSAQMLCPVSPRCMLGA
jgi:hypothetical protein